MLRRSFAKLMLGAAAMGAGGLAMTGMVESLGAGRAPRVRPGDPGWPSPAEWSSLENAIGGRLIRPLEDEAQAAPLASATRPAGWVDAWMAEPSAYVVAAASVADVAAAVTFARQNNLRLVVDDGGRDLLGRASSADSLMLSTHGLNQIELVEAFVPKGGDGVDTPARAVHVGPGVDFLSLYHEVCVRNGRYVQGARRLTESVGAHLASGGFGSFSKSFGASAASLLEAEIVTADGATRVVNRHRHPDLFFALRGGGSAFGVLVRATLGVHETAVELGAFRQTFRAKSDVAFQRLLAAFSAFAGETLLSRHWGEQVLVNADNSLEIDLVFHGLDEEKVRALWTPLWSWLEMRPEDYETDAARITITTSNRWWDAEFWRDHHPERIIVDDHADGRKEAFRWAADNAEAGAFVAAHDSVWLPKELLKPAHRDDLAKALFAASRAASVTLNLHMGLAGAPEAVRRESGALALNPVVLDAFALAVISKLQPNRGPGLPGREPDLGAARWDAKQAEAAMSRLRAIAPNGGAYPPEANHHDADWRDNGWGPVYGRLLAVKREVDPDGLFYGHNWPGAEFWLDDGFTPVTEDARIA